MHRTCLLLAAILFGFAADARGQHEFELVEGDRVVLLGNSFFERALDYGHIETSLALRWPQRKIVFRNLGWDGDTVYGHSRAGGRRRAVFGDAEEGFQRMVRHVRSLQPTVIFMAYGLNESFDGETGVERFRAGLKRLLAELDSGSTRFVLLSPIPLEAGFGAELPRGDVGASTYISRRNKVMEKYRDIIAEEALAGEHHFVDLFTALAKSGEALTENGLHPADHGYRKIAQIIAEQLKLSSATIDLDSDAAEEIRTSIVKKNALYFHRWRPRNNAFVYGERKDEQKIAQTEPEKFEPFIEQQELAVRRLLAKLGGAK